MTDSAKTNHRPVHRISRRQVLRSVGAGAALALGGSLTAAAPRDEKPCSEPKGLLQRDDRVPLEGKPGWARWNVSQSAGGFSGQAGIWGT